MSQYLTSGSGPKTYRKKEENAIHFKGTLNNTKKYGTNKKVTFTYNRPWRARKRVRGKTIKFANSPPCACRDIRGIVHYEFVPTGQTVNQFYYLEVLKRLHEKVARKRPELFANNSWILHHDNAPAHTALSVREFLATNQITVLEHPAYSPHLAPVTFSCFRR